MVATGAGDGIRTRDQELGKLLLYQLSYARTADGAGIVTHCSVKYSVKRRANAPEGPVRYAAARMVTGSWAASVPPRALPQRESGIVFSWPGATSILTGVEVERSVYAPELTFRTSMRFSVIGSLVRFAIERA